jgi:hypothetical protein
MRRHLRAAAAALAAAALLALAGGCGDEPSASVVTPPQGEATPTVINPVAIGGAVTPGPATPAAITRALADDQIIVIGFLIDGAAEDARVGDALDRVEGDGRAKVFVYGVGNSQGFGDLADLLGVTGTPTVAVIGADGTLRNRFTGLVDAEVLRQSVADARDVGVSDPSGATATG